MLREAAKPLRRKPPRCAGAVVTTGLRRRRRRRIHRDRCRILEVPRHIELSRNRLRSPSATRACLMAAGGSFAVLLLLAVNAACIAGILAIIVRRQPGWAAVGVIGLWGVSVLATAVLAWQIGHLMTAYDEVYG